MSSTLGGVCELGSGTEADVDATTCCGVEMSVGAFAAAECVVDVDGCPSPSNSAVNNPMSLLHYSTIQNKNL